MSNPVLAMHPEATYVGRFGANCNAFVVVPAQRRYAWRAFLQADPSGPRATSVEWEADLGTAQFEAACDLYETREG